MQVAMSQGILVLGGPGAYVIEGRSNSGKNFLLDHMITHAKHSGLEFSNIVTFSGSQEENDSLNFIETLYNSDIWAIAKSLAEVEFVVMTRKKHLASLRAEKGGDEDAKRFKADNPMLLILDDFGGLVNMTTNVKSQWYQYITTVRNMGIYLVMLIQYPKQIGPAFWNQCKAVISFDRSETGLRHYAKAAGITLSKQVLAKILSWMKKKHRYLVWFRDWNIDEPLPDQPWVGYKLEAMEQPRFMECTELLYEVNNTQNEDEEQ